MITAHHLAGRFLGLHEVHGTVNSPAIVAMLQLVDPQVHDDETAWCSAFVGTIAYLLELPQSHSLAARSWLRVGSPVPIDDAIVGSDVVILQRGGSGQPGPEVTAAPGHVGFFGGFDGPDRLIVRGGNQGDAVSDVAFPRARVLGIRRLI